MRSMTGARRDPRRPLVSRGRRIQGGFIYWLKDRKNRRVIPHRLEKCGYTPVRNPDAKDGMWRIRNKRQAIYASKTLTLREQIGAARGLT
jgi:hypothetical protein